LCIDSALLLSIFNILCIDSALFVCLSVPKLLKFNSCFGFKVLLK
jgi:hypothetical protein